MEYSEQAPPDLFSMSPVPPASEVIRADAIPAPPGYTSPSSRARWARVLLGMTLVVQVLSLFALGAQRSLLNRGLGQVTVSEWHTSNGRISHLATLQLILLLITAIAFLRWLHRCYVNLVAVGTRDLRFTPGWAVGYWFVPILNLFRPKQILDELWRATSPLDDGDSAGAKTSLTALWLCALLTSAVTARIGAAVGAGSITDLKRASTWLIVSCLADIAAAGLTYRLVSSLTARQELRVTR
jgi:hypothetical protein